ncbi:baseplate assembly protein [Geobacter sp. SVR]|uniref:baseplate assembly protein n=1 Tax=Geobacter sp. SVR TaxID=2495594 RepID=UPI00143EFE1E|nr:baseplate assembly protein [Geobacter sp. SVR]BCS55205.1 baseplate assembly protein [Geobacter sp. SVR]GCF86006.1 baseplate assembly protein [Geobacter sp. SVR]
MDDLFGRDIALDDLGSPLVAGNGELILTDGAATGVQDIRLRLGTPLGSLFYDTEFGSLIHEWYRDENDRARRDAFEAEVEQRVEEDPRVVLGTANCTVISSDDRGFTANVSFEFIGEDHPFNLVLTLNSDKQEMVIKDVNPRSGL